MESRISDMQCKKKQSISASHNNSFDRRRTILNYVTLNEHQHSHSSVFEHQNIGGVSRDTIRGWVILNLEFNERFTKHITTTARYIPIHFKSSATRRFKNADIAASRRIDAQSKLSTFSVSQTTFVYEEIEGSTAGTINNVVTTVQYNHCFKNLNCPRYVAVEFLL